MKNYLRPLASLKLTIFCLATLMALVVYCTLAQVNLGTFAAVEATMRKFLILWKFPGKDIKIPIFPGGGLIGFLLLINLSFSFILRFRLTKHKTGIWMIHGGLILFVLAEFVTGFFSIESQLAFEEGQSRNYTEDPRHVELAVIDRSPATYDEVRSIREKILSKEKKIDPQGLPFQLVIKRFFRNAMVSQANPSAPMAVAGATEGIGVGLAVFPLDPVSSDEDRDNTSAYVEILSGSTSVGTWLLSLSLEPQSITVDGKQYLLAIRPTRYYLPFTLTLNDFRHDVYPGTDIPKNFSSLVHLNHPEKGEDRDVLIYMNHPLRYGGKTFYQASFGKDDTLSVLQVVKNPGWLLPYIAFGIVGIGLLVQFLIHFFAFLPSHAQREAHP